MISTLLLFKEQKEPEKKEGVDFCLSIDFLQFVGDAMWDGPCNSSHIVHNHCSLFALLQIMFIAHWGCFFLFKHRYSFNEETSTYEEVHEVASNVS